MLEELLARVTIRAVAIWESATAGCVEAEIELFCNTEPRLPVLEAVVYIREYNDLYGSFYRVDLCTSAVLYGGTVGNSRESPPMLTWLFFFFYVNVNLQKSICSLIAVSSLQYTLPLKMGK